MQSIRVPFVTVQRAQYQEDRGCRFNTVLRLRQRLWGPHQSATTVVLENCISKSYNLDLGHLALTSIELLVSKISDHLHVLASDPKFSQLDHPLLVDGG